MDITPEALTTMVEDASRKGAEAAVRAINPVAESDRPAGGKSAKVEAPNILVNRPRTLSIGKAIRATMLGSWKKAGAELEKDFTEATRQMFPDHFSDAEYGNFSWPATPEAYYNVLEEGAFRSVDSEFQKAAYRALTEGSPTTSASGGGVLTPIAFLQDQFVLALTSAVTIQNVPGVETIPISNPVVSIPRESVAATSSVAAEAGTLSASDPSFAQQVITAKKVYGYKQYSNELLADANPALNAYLARTLARDVALQKDLQFLTGSGAGANLQGIAGYSGLTTSAGIPATNGQAPTYDNFVQMIWALRRANAEPSAFVMHPAVGQALAQLKDSAGRPLFLDGNLYALGGANMPIAGMGQNFTYPGPARGTILNIPVFFSTQLSITQTQGTSGNCTTVYLGNFNFCKILERAAVDIAVSEHILFTTDQTAMRAIWRGALALTQPAAFMAVAGFTVS